jgi:hypothetical protein
VRQALDNALLAATTELSQGEDAQSAKQAGEDAFEKNIATLGVDAACDTLAVTSDTATRRIMGTADCTMPLTFAAVIGQGDMQLTPQDEAAYGGEKIEIALMLDVSGSMRGQRLADLQEAANSLKDTLIPVSGAGDVRVALAPYSTAVNAGAYGDVATGITDLYAHTVENLGADPNKLIDALVTSGTSETFDLVDSAGNDGLGALPPEFFAYADVADPVEIPSPPFVCETRGSDNVGSDGCSQWSSSGRDIYHLPQSMFPVRTGPLLQNYYNDGDEDDEPDCSGGCPHSLPENITDYTYEEVHGGTVPADCIDGSASSSQTATDWQALDWTAASLSYTDYDWSVLGAEHAVNVGILNCVTERAGTQAFTDASPVTYPLGAEASSCPRAAVEPLTHDTSILKTAIGDLYADGWTAGHLGIAWSWYTLSPDWSAVWPFNKRTEHGGAQAVKRYAILMTDGSFNTHYEAGLGNSSDQAASLCDAMKSDGIEIYSVAFNAPASSRAVLEACASSSGNFYEPTTGAELIDVYDEIAGGLDQVRLTR